MKVTLEVVEGPAAAQEPGGLELGVTGVINVAVEVLEVGGLELEIIVVVDVVVAMLGGGLGSSRCALRNARRWRVGAGNRRRIWLDILSRHRVELDIESVASLSHSLLKREPCICKLLDEIPHVPRNRS